MKKMKFILFAAMLAAVLFSNTFPSKYVDIVGSKEIGTGNSIWPQINYNCTQKAVNATLYGGADPLADANAYLFYLDYSYQLVGNDRTDSSGKADLRVTGKDNLLTKVFVLRVEKTGYKTLEVQFAINCSKTYSADPPSWNNSTANNSSSNSSANVNASNHPNPNAPNNANSSSNLSNTVNSAARDAEKSLNKSIATGSLPCASAFLIPLSGLLVFRLKTRKHL